MDLKTQLIFAESLADSFVSSIKAIVTPFSRSKKDETHYTDRISDEKFSLNQMASVLSIASFVA
jgi:hypothetical protein